MATYLITGVLVARLAGPEIFGLYSSFLATAVIFTVFASLGQNALLIKEFFRANEPRKVMVNAFVMRIQAAAISGLALLVAVIWLLEAEITAGLLTLALVPIATFQIADCFFEARRQMQTVLLYKAPAYGIGLILKVSVAAFAPDAVLLLAAHLAEMGVIFIGSALSILKTAGRPQHGDMDWSYQKHLFRSGMPLMFSSVAVILYMKIDVSMVLRLSGAADAGIYAVATRLCEALFILSAPIIIAVFPRLLALHVEDQEAYATYMRRVFAILLGGGVLIAIVTFALSGWLIALLFGVDYAVSAQVLRIYALSTPLIFLGDLFSRWIVLSDNLGLSSQRHLWGLVTNIALNFLLIPMHGPVGAAVASVAGNIVATIAFSVLHPKARPFYTFLRTS